MPPSTRESETLAPRGARRSLRRRLAPPTLVLAYHRVVPSIGADVNQLCVSAENFAEHLRWLRAACRLIGPREFLGQLGRGPLAGVALDGGRPRVLVTFDDGYADNVLHALPILTENGAQAILFATSGAVGSTEAFWWDALEQIVYRGHPSASGWRLADVAIPADLPPAEAYTALHRLVLPLDSQSRAAALADLADQAGVTTRADEHSRPVTRDELLAWAAAGCDIGAHTRTHVQLSAQRDDQVTLEISGARRDLQQLTGLAIDTLAYPFGTGGDFDERAEAAARAAGYRCAFANRAGNARWARNRYALPRYLVRNWSGQEFAARFMTWCPP